MSEARSSNSVEFQILTRLNDIVRNLAVLNTKLFGDEDGEANTGRLPQVEIAVLNLVTRVTELEQFRWKMAGGLILISIVFGVAAEKFFKL